MCVADETKVRLLVALGLVLFDFILVEVEFKMLAAVGTIHLAFFYHILVKVDAVATARANDLIQVAVLAAVTVVIVAFFVVIDNLFEPVKILVDHVNLLAEFADNLLQITDFKRNVV